jgi:hypothetical protein
MPRLQIQDNIWSVLSRLDPQAATVPITGGIMYTWINITADPMRICRTYPQLASSYNASARRVEYFKSFALPLAGRADVHTVLASRNRLDACVDSEHGWHTAVAPVNCLSVIITV